MHKHFIDWTENRLKKWQEWGRFVGGFTLRIENESVPSDEIQMQQRGQDWNIAAFKSYIDELCSSKVACLVVAHASDIISYDVPIKDNLVRLLQTNNRAYILIVSGEKGGVIWNAQQYPPQTKQFHCMHSSLILDNSFLSCLDKMVDELDREPAADVWHYLYSYRVKSTFNALCVLCQGYLVAHAANTSPLFQTALDQLGFNALDKVQQEYYREVLRGRDKQTEDVTWWRNVFKDYGYEGVIENIQVETGQDMPAHIKELLDSIYIGGSLLDDLMVANAYNQLVKLMKS